MKNDPRNKITSRSTALKWWNSLMYEERLVLTPTLTDKEIEEIWKKENLRKKVDFEKIKSFKEDFENISYLNPVLQAEWIQELLENMYLMIEMLSKSSSFAHKIHKELQNK